MQNSFDSMPPVGTCTDGAAPTMTALTMESLREIMAKLPAGPTAEQKEWARQNGFPGFPGFKVGVGAWAMLREMSTISSGRMVRLRAAELPGLSWAGSVHGVPVLLDESLPPNVVVSAEEEWALRMVEVCCD